MAASHRSLPSRSRGHMWPPAISCWMKGPEVKADQPETSCRVIRLSSEPLKAMTRKSKGGSLAWHHSYSSKHLRSSRSGFVHFGPQASSVSSQN